MLTNESRTARTLPNSTKSESYFRMIAFVTVEGTGKTCSACNRPAYERTANNILFLNERADNKRLYCSECARAQCVPGTAFHLYRLEGDRPRSPVSSGRALANLLVQRPASSVRLPQRRDERRQAAVGVVPGQDRERRHVPHRRNNPRTGETGVDDRPREDAPSQ